jgi:hypothetical protein
MRKFLFVPSAMIWPANLVNCALFRTLHDDKDNDSKEEANKESHWTMSRLKFFFLSNILSIFYGIGFLVISFLFYHFSLGYV